MKVHDVSLSLKGGIRRNLKLKGGQSPPCGSEEMKVYDISRPIFEGMATYPSDPKPKINSFKKIPDSSSNVSEILLGSHTGTHVDAKAHLANDADGVDMLPLDSLVGECRVFDLTHVKNEITEVELSKLDIRKGDIVLFKTRNSFLDENEFHTDFVYFTLDAAKYLRKKGVKTVGIDYVSVQKYKSGSSLVHAEFINNSITVFEHLILRDVPAGEYLFVGLPLPIRGCDGAPARAVLIRQDIRQ